ncbi:MAG: radical SAM protein [Planctomycetota bacterium]
MTPRVILLNRSLPGALDAGTWPEAAATLPLLPAAVETRSWPGDGGWVVYVVSTGCVAWMDDVGRQCLAGIWTAPFAGLQTWPRETCGETEARTTLATVLRAIGTNSGKRTSAVPFSVDDEYVSRRQLTGLTLTVTGRCNLRCSYCFGEKEYMHQKEVMTGDVARRALDVLFQGDVQTARRVEFFGGEPLLAFDTMREAVEYTEARGYRVGFAVTTNGSLLSPGVARFLGDHRFDVSVSLDGPPRHHDGPRKLPSGAGSAGAVLRGLECLRRFAPNVKTQINTVLTHRSIQHAVEIIEFLLGEGFRNIYLCPVRGGGNEFAFTESDHATFRDLQRLIVSMRLTDTRYADVDLGGFGAVADRVARGTKCHYGCGADIGLSSACVLPNGDLYPCYRLAKLDEFKIGNVARELSHAWRVPFFNNNVDNRECRSCWARYLCGGGCPAQALLSTGDLRRPDRQGCRVVLENTEDIIRTFATAALARFTSDEGPGPLGDATVAREHGP